MRPRFLWLLALWLGAACGPEPAVHSIPIGDLATFEAEVMPYLSERCASGGCHGDPDRPLSLYSPGAHRADPTRRSLDEPLDAAELLANARRVRAWALTAQASESLMVRKPLAASVGGVWHGGGDVFVDEHDAACRALVAWLDSSPPPDGGYR